MTYTNIQRIAFLFHYFFPSYHTYPKAARLASLPPPSPLHTPARIRGAADSQAADHVSCAATPARKRDTRLLAFAPPLQVYIYIYRSVLSLANCFEERRCLLCHTIAKGWARALESKVAS